MIDQKLQEQLTTLLSNPQVKEQRDDGVGKSIEADAIALKVVDQVGVILGKAIRKGESSEISKAFKTIRETFKSLSLPKALENSFLSMLLNFLLINVVTLTSYQTKKELAQVLLDGSSEDLSELSRNQLAGIGLGE